MPRTTLITLPTERTKIMGKFNNSHILILSLLAALLLITPFLSSNLRPTYLYFITNILIFALGAEAGLFSVFSGSPNGKCYANNNNSGVDPDLSYDVVTLEKIENSTSRVRLVEKCVSEKVSAINVDVKKKEAEFKRCPSMPSLFFIGGMPEAETDSAYQEADSGRDQEDEPVDEGIISGQELFTKAETFIGNFYKQLSIQREESWKRIHGFYQKAF